MCYGLCLLGKLAVFFLKFLNRDLKFVSNPMFGNSKVVWELHTILPWDVILLQLWSSRMVKINISICLIQFYSSKTFVKFIVYNYENNINYMHFRTFQTYSIVYLVSLVQFVGCTHMNRWVHLSVILFQVPSFMYFLFY